MFIKINGALISVQDADVVCRVRIYRALVQSCPHLMSIFLGSCFKFVIHPLPLVTTAFMLGRVVSIIDFPHVHVIYRRSGNFRVRKLLYDKFSCKKFFVGTTPYRISVNSAR